MTVVIESVQVIICDVLVCVKYAIRLQFLLIYLSLWQMIHCSLQTKTNKKAVLCGRETVRTMLNLQSIARFSMR